MDIRDEQPADQVQVRRLLTLAFDGDVQADIVDELRNRARPYVSLVAVEAGTVVGHIFFSCATVANALAPRSAQLSPVAVLPDDQGRGIGSALIEAGLKAALAQNWTAVFLVGNPRYYARFGFRLAKEKQLHCEGPHDPYLQYVELAAGSLAGVRGTVSFHPVFDELDR